MRTTINPQQPMQNAPWYGPGPGRWGHASSAPGGQPPREGSARSRVRDLAMVGTEGRARSGAYADQANGAENEFLPALSQDIPNASIRAVLARPAASVSAGKPMPLTRTPNPVLSNGDT